MQRMLIDETPEKIGEKVRLKGWVTIQRDHGKVIFIDLRDRSSVIQLVITKDNADAFEKAKKSCSESAIEVIGTVKERPKNLVNEKISTGGVEVEVESLKILSVAVELPLEVSKAELDLNLQTLLERRNLALRNEKIKSIFFVSASVLDGYRNAMKEKQFTEIKTPKILSAATEGGANFFKIDYFDSEAFLAQSPQFYKQMGVGVFERVFEVGPVFRAEPHFTSRHVNEYISLDAEMGFIDSYEQIMDELEGVIWKIMENVKKQRSDVLKKYNASVPEKMEIPRMKLSDALEILEKEFGKKSEAFDIDPEGERLICEYVKKEKGSDLIFLTHYPTSIRPMYTMPNEEDKELTNSFDLLFRGVEIATGGQRIHSYEQLKKSISDRGIDPDQFKYYLEIFQYGMPPHGGWGMGSERVVQKILGLKSIKEAVLYPRDVKRLIP
ncbi:MAG: aspartate--tRNA(Asn) ligase [Patescibacteria group bacterium]|nr:aspartate--tRNA(Asn) ligase [Patescibacteria group bacterium]